MSKTALITGIAGQDGSYLAEYLLNEGYSVVGIEKSFDPETPGNLAAAFEIVRGDTSRLRVLTVDLMDTNGIESLIKDIQPDEVYNFAAQSHVGLSFEKPELTAEVTGLGPLRILESIRKYSPHTKFLQASSSEIFETPVDTTIPLNEESPKKPRNPYGISKYFAHQIVDCYREVHGLYALNAILFNHESPRRGGEFVTKKIAREMTLIANGKSDGFQLGNLDGGRDWGYAPNYVGGMHAVLQTDSPQNIVFATGMIHTVRELVRISAEILDIPIRFEGEGMTERVTRTDSQDVIITISEEFYRPIESAPVRGDSSRLQELTGWKPSSVLQELMEEMITIEKKTLA